MRRTVWVIAAVTILALAAACSGGSHTTHPAVTPPGPNPDVIPAVITPAYVDAVFKVLNHIDGNVIRLLEAEHIVSPAVREDYRAIYNDPMYQSELAAADESLRQGAIENVRANPGDAITNVVRVISASDKCIFAQTRTDLSAVFIQPRPLPASEYYELSPKQRGADPLHLNRTPWAISFNVAYLQPTNAQSRC